jgi:hypothetical protein
MSVPLDPYPLPPGWSLRPARPRSRRTTGVLVASCLVLAAALWGAVAAEQTLLAMGVALVFLVVLAVVAFGAERAGGERALPEFINALALTRAETRPADSWVSFFRQRAPTLWSCLWLLVGGVGTTLACGILVVRCVQEGGQALLILIYLIPLTLAAAVVALAGSNSLAVRGRARWFARRPRGLMVGRTGITLYSFDRGDYDRAWSWDAIADVVPGGLVDARTGNGVPELKLHVTGADGAVEEVPLPVDALESHAWLVYAVLRFWKENPKLRDELDTSAAQDRMEDWMAGLSTAADAQRG